MALNSGARRLEAFRLLGGPCHGQIAELPTEGFEVWRCTPAEELTYARYERDGAVFRFAGEEMSGQALVEALKEKESEPTLHVDSREYER